MRPVESASTTALLDAPVIIPVTRQVAEQAGYFKARTRAPGLELADWLIAATALIEGPSLPTGNVKDYPDARDHRGHCLTVLK